MVYTYLRRDVPTGPKRPQFHRSAQVLNPYMPYSIRRWPERGADSKQLWRAIRALGYTHSAQTVCRLIIQLRRTIEAGYAPEPQGSPETRPQGLSSRTIAVAIVCPIEKRSAEVQTYRDQLCQLDARSARAHALIQDFLALVRECRGNDLEAWSADAAHGGIVELARFARGLQDDLGAIKAGLICAAARVKSWWRCALTREVSAIISTSAPLWAMMAQDLALRLMETPRVGDIPCQHDARRCPP
jgi:transposase